MAEARVAKFCAHLEHTRWLRFMMCVRIVVMFMRCWLCTWCRRAVAQRCPQPPMHNLISIGGQHQGMLLFLFDIWTHLSHSRFDAGFKVSYILHSTWLGLRKWTARQHLSCVLHCVCCFLIQQFCYAVFGYWCCTAGIKCAVSLALRVEQEKMMKPVTGLVDSSEST